MNLPLPMPQKCKHLISIYSFEVNVFCRYTKIKDAIIDRRQGDIGKSAGRVISKNLQSGFSFIPSRSCASGNSAEVPRFHTTILLRVTNFYQGVIKNPGQP